MKVLGVCISALFVSLLACNAKAQDGAAFGAWGIEIEGVSKTVSAGDDFFTYVNEGWLKETELPPGRSSLSQSNVLGLETREAVRSMLEDLVEKDLAVGTPAQRVGDFYASYLNDERIQQLGLAPVADGLDAVSAITDHEGVARFMARPSAASIATLSVWLDPGDPGRHVLWLDQYGSSFGQRQLGLRRALYLGDDDRTLAVLDGYENYIADVFRIIGYEEPEKRAAEVLQLEKRIAGVMWTPAQVRDRDANYHLVDLAGLEAYAAGFPWRTLLSERGVANAEAINIGTDSAIRDTAAIFAETPIEHWKAYLAFHWIDNHWYLLSSDVSDVAFAFKGPVLSGVTERSPAGLRAINFVSRHLGQEVGRLYIDERFSEADRAAADEMVVYLRRAFESALENAAWMDDETRGEALAKLRKMRVSVGFPTDWKDYSSLRVDPDDPIGNLARARDVAWSHDVAMLGRSFPKGAWISILHPHTVDASFSPALNAIFFPAGQMQAPFFDAHADPAVNFGANGAVIAHEMGHGFDDQGSRFDGDGRLRDWWTPRSRKAFNERTEALVKQYEAFEPLPGVTLNAKAMLGENIADLTGVSLAYRAWRLYVDENYDGKAPVLDGFTGDQRFFMAWAQAFRTIYSQDALRTAARNNFHPPSMYRVNGVMRNIDAWYDAFDVDEDDDLFLAPADRVRLW